jgi:hypothetical protein
LRKVSMKVNDPLPQDAFQAQMNRLFIFGCIVVVYLPAITDTDANMCIGFEHRFAIGARSTVNAAYLARIAL